MQIASLLLLSVLSTGAASAASASFPPSAMALPGDAVSLDTPFNVTSHTQVPGATLKPGKYIITIKDHLSDRVILQISNASGKVETTFLGVFRSSLQNTGSPGPIRLSTDKGSDALVGFNFPGSRPVEFVYPKAEAAGLVGRSPQEVLAIDPPSDNLKSSGKNMDRSDAQVVTLWSLQVAPVNGTQKGGIAAKKYVSSEPAQAVASNASPAPAVASPAAAPSPRAQRPAPQPAAQVAQNRVPAIKALPKTGSNLPLLLSIMAGSFTLAAGFRVKHQYSRER